MTLETAFKQGIALLEKHNIEDAKLDAWYLMEHCFHITRVEYLLNSKEPVGEEEYVEYINFIQQRSSHIPLQYLTKVQEFMGLAFHIKEGVLIPRQDTEVLVTEVLKMCRGKTVLDMCTGSGCIIISLDKLGQIDNGMGVDVSEEALEIARKNGEQLNSEVTFLKSNLFEAVHEKFDIIVSNPPYIPTGIINSLMKEVKEHEPLLALDGKEDGLYFYRAIAQRLQDFLQPGGYIFFEIGHDQGNAVSEILLAAGITEVRVSKDLAGLDRVVSGKYKTSEE